MLGLWLIEVIAMWHQQHFNKGLQYLKFASNQNLNPSYGISWGTPVSTSCFKGLLPCRLIQFPDGTSSCIFALVSTYLFTHSYSFKNALMKKTKHKQKDRKCMNEYMEHLLFPQVPWWVLVAFTYVNYVFFSNCSLFCFPFFPLVFKVWSNSRLTKKLQKWYKEFL